MLNDLIDSNKGPFNDNTIKQLFKKKFSKPLQIYKNLKMKNIYMYHVS